MTTTSPEAARLVDLYIRLSNADEAADSLERQEKDLREWAAREGLNVREVWSDNGISGFKKDAQRDGFDAAVKAVASGEVSTLAVWKLDRLSRRGAGHVGTILDDLEEAGGRLVFLKDGLDTTYSSARLVIVTISEIARAESANTSTRVKSRKASDRAAGRYLGGAAPLGYAVGEDRLLRPHPAEFDLMRELVRRILGGESLLAVARNWNARQIPTRRLPTWLRKEREGMHRVALLDLPDLNEDRHRDFALAVLGVRDFATSSMSGTKRVAWFAAVAHLGATFRLSSADEFSNAHATVTAWSRTPAAG